MRKHILLYGLLCGVLIVVLRLIEYRWLVLSHSLEIYGALVAAIFAGVGIWLGRRLTGPPREVVREVVVEQATPFARDAERVSALGITPRELEILEQIAGGLSTREIAERLFVSENTVKTHLSRLFEKLGARRRTQVIQRAREARLIP